MVVMVTSSMNSCPVPELIISDPQFSQRYTRIQYDMFSTVTADEFWYLTRWDMHTQMLLVHSQVTTPNKWFSTQTDGLHQNRCFSTQRWFCTLTNGSVPRHIVLHLNRRFSLPWQISLHPLHMVLYQDRWLCAQKRGSVPRQMVLHLKRWFSLPWQMVLHPVRWFSTQTDVLAP
jgi:hypothetical protein